METGIGNFFNYFKETFGIEHRSPESYSPLALAYIGDSIFDLMVRTMAVSNANKQTQKYHDEVTRLVCAPAQAKMMKGIRERLTEEEHAIYKRGRNANTNTKAKNASLSDYRNATAFEAVLGYLYLKEDFTRLSDVVKMALDVFENWDEEAYKSKKANGNIDDKDINDSFQVSKDQEIYDADGSGD